MFILRVVRRVMLPATWLGKRKRALKLERMERRLLNCNQIEYAPVRKLAEAAKTLPLSTC
jgi:hypothetical protein